MGVNIFYPDADPESTSVDGRVNSFQDNVVWMPTIPSAANDTEAQSGVVQVISSDSTDRWDAVGRGIFLFDTSSLGSSANITDASLTLNVSAKLNGLSGNTFKFNIYSSNPNSNTALIANDFSTIGSTAFSTDIDYSTLSVGNNVWDLNASGISNISKTGISKFAIAESYYDKGPFTPTWTSTQAMRITANMAESGTNKPKLTVTTSEFDKFQLNIDDSWKDVVAIKINIVDSWKEVIGAWINIGGVWKLIL